MDSTFQVLKSFSIFDSITFFPDTCLNHLLSCFFHTVQNFDFHFIGPHLI